MVLPLSECLPTLGLVMVMVTCLFHAEPLADLPLVVVALALLAAAAVALLAAERALLLGRHAAVVLPRVADVLKQRKQLL